MASADKSRAKTMIMRKILRREPVNTGLRDVQVSLLSDAQGAVQKKPRAAARKSATKETGHGAIKESWGWQGQFLGRAAYTKPAFWEF
jgi:hypothetical protein